MYVMKTNICYIISFFFFCFVLFCFVFFCFLNETVLETNVRQKYEHLSFDPTVFQTDGSDGD